MIATLPMYDRAETAAANDTLWRLTREELGFGPKTLTRSDDIWGMWAAPDLLLGQTCNLPYRLRLHGKVQLIGSPDYQLPGCPPGYYNSVLIARADDARPVEALLRARVIINQSHSQSGFAALWFHAQARNLVPNICAISGGHIQSALTIARGDGDIAAIDALTWRLIKRHGPHTANLREISRTAPTPATPFITSLSQEPGAIRTALRRAISRLDKDIRAMICLHGIQTLNESKYLDLPTPPALQFAQVNVP